MPNAPRDPNFVPVGLADAENGSVAPLHAEGVEDRLLVSVEAMPPGGTPPTALGARDGNYVPVAMGVSDADGVTPLPLYADDDGNLVLDLTLS